MISDCWLSEVRWKLVEEAGKEAPPKSLTPEQILEVAWKNNDYETIAQCTKLEVLDRTTYSILRGPQTVQTEKDSSRSEAKKTEN
jgi:hypothetical protein